MKKLLLLLLLAFSLFVSTGCDDNNTKHKLTYERLEEEKGMLYSYPKEGLYKVGEELVIKVYVVTDTSLHVFLNKEDLRKTDSERQRESTSIILSRKSRSLRFSTAFGQIRVQERLQRKKPEICFKTKAAPSGAVLFERILLYISFNHITVCLGPQMLAC